MFKGNILAAAPFGFRAAAVELASAESPAPAKQNANEDKASDRTRGSLTPDRTQGANRSGAAGADAGQTSQGTSDRTLMLQRRPTRPRQLVATCSRKSSPAAILRAWYTHISELTKDANGKAMSLPTELRQLIAASAPAYHQAPIKFPRARATQLAADGYPKFVADSASVPAERPQAPIAHV